MIFARTASAMVAATAFCSIACAQQVEFDLTDTITFGDTDIDYRLDIVMSAVTPTRVGVVALLDLRSFQDRLPDLIAEEPVSDGCGSRTDLTSLAVEVDGEVISLVGELNTQFFECTRTDEANFRRGTPTDRWQLGFDASASARLEGTCLTIKLEDMVVRQLAEVEERDGLAEDLDALRVILVEFAGKFLEKRPLCPELPDELGSLDPVYKSGGPREIGDRGLGFYIDGSIDVSTTTILSVLRILQREEVIPGPP